MRAAVAFVVVCGLALPAWAHKSVPTERGILQLKPDGTELLYELLIPAGPTAAHWRLQFDANHDGRLSDEEYRQLAQGLAEALRTRLVLRLEGNALPFKIIDAKVTSTDSMEPLSGRLSAILWLKTRDVPPGERKLEMELKPIVDPALPAVIRLEPLNGSVESVTGAIHVKLEDGADGVKLREGMHCEIIVNVTSKTR